MKKLTGLLKILIISFILSLCFRFGSNLYTVYNQDHLAKEICDLVALPLQTSSLRTAYENMQSALLKTTKAKSCISILDGGRSYSPSCIQDDVQYRTTRCKVEGNTSVLASISFAEERFFQFDFLFIFLITAVSIFLFITLINGLSQLITYELSKEIKNLLNFESKSDQKQNTIQSIIKYFLAKLGVQNTLKDKSADIKLNFQKYEFQIKSELLKKIRLEEDQKKSQEYIEKVKQIFQTKVYFEMQLQLKKLKVF